MQKTPDDIKNGIYWCSKPVESMDCEQCPYYGIKDCVDNMCSDTAGLVKQLEAELEDMTARYKIADDCAKKKGEMNEKLYAELSAVKAERDAAVKSLRGRCFECKHNKTSVCLICSKDKALKYWEWRGVTKEG